MVPARAQDVYGEPDVPIAGQVLGTVVHTTDTEELRYLVLMQLTDRYAADKGVEVMQAEKDAYVEHLQAKMAQDRKRQEARRDELTRRLASDDLSEGERTSLGAERDTLNELLANLAELAEKAAENPEEAAAAREAPP